MLDNDTQFQALSTGLNTSRAAPKTPYLRSVHHHKYNSMKIKHKDGKVKGSKASNVSLMLRKTQYHYKNMNSSFSLSGLLNHKDQGENVKYQKNNQSLCTSMR